MQLPWTQAGLPLLTIPYGFLEGLPLGLQLSAPVGRDENLLNWGFMLEAGLNTVQ